MALHRPGSGSDGVAGTDDLVARRRMDRLDHPAEVVVFKAGHIAPGIPRPVLPRAVIMRLDFRSQLRTICDLMLINR